MTTTYTPEQLKRGRLKLLDAQAWRKDNPRAWHYIVRYALDAAANGRRLGGQEVVEAVRAHDFTDEYGRPTRVNNDHAAVFVRLLVAEYPQLDTLIERRASVFDLLMTPLENEGANHDEL